MPLPTDLDVNGSKNFIRKLVGTDSADFKQNSFIGSFIFFDVLSSQAHIDK